MWAKMQQWKCHCVHFFFTMLWKFMPHRSRTYYYSVLHYLSSCSWWDCSHFNLLIYLPSLITLICCAFLYYFISLLWSDWHSIHCTLSFIMTVCFHPFCVMDGSVIQRLTVLVRYPTLLSYPSTGLDNLDHCHEKFQLKRTSSVADPGFLNRGFSFEPAFDRSTCKGGMGHPPSPAGNFWKLTAKCLRLVQFQSERHGLLVPCNFIESSAVQDAEIAIQNIARNGSQFTFTLRESMLQVLFWGSAGHWHL